MTRFSAQDCLSVCPAPALATDDARGQEQWRSMSGDPLDELHLLLRLLLSLYCFNFSDDQRSVETHRHAGTWASCCPLSLSLADRLSPQTQARERYRGSEQKSRDAVRVEEGGRPSERSHKMRASVT